MTSRKWLIALVAVVALLSGWVARALTMTGGGQIKSFDGIQVGTPQPGSHACTSSLDFEVMPDTTFTFTSPGGDAVFMFQGQFGAFTSTAPNRPIVQLMVDGLNVGLAVVGSDLNGANQIHTFGYNAFTTLTAGTHTAWVEWHTAPNPATSCVEERSLIVLHK
jgi:hypothetical protein